MNEKLTMPEETIEQLVDNCTLEEVRTLAIAAVTAHAEDTVHWDEAIDARMAMTATLENAMPDRVLSAEAEATVNGPDKDYIVEQDYGLMNLWRPYLGLGRLNEEGVEMTREDVMLSWGGPNAAGTQTVGVRRSQNDEGQDMWMVAKWSNGDLLGYLIPVDDEDPAQVYAAVLHAPYDVVRALRDKGEDLDLDEATSLGHAEDRLHDHPMDQFFTGARHLALAHIVTEATERYTRNQKEG